MANARHPLLLVRRPMFWTPRMDDLGRAINLGIEFNRHGIIVIGDGRIGKSEALVLLSQTLTWRNYACYWHSLLCPKPGQSTEGYFFNNLRLSAALKVREQTQPIFSIYHVVNFLCEQAALAGAEVIILSIDDANRLLREDYNHLATLDNHITARGYRLFVILMVQRDADQSNLPTITTEQYPSHITGRFTADEYFYTGLQGLSEIRIGMANRAKQTWPEGGATFEEHFAPKAAASGWCFEQGAEGLLKAAEEARAKANLDPHAPFPMQPFDTATYYLLVRVAGENPEFMGFTLDHFSAAIDLSGLIPLEKSRLPKDLQLPKERP